MSGRPAGAGAVPRASLRVSRTHFPVTALGPGVRLGVWVQGCPLACRGCMARDTWNAGGGLAVDVDELAEIWRGAVAHGATGLTVSGGEPLAQPVATLAFLEAARRVSAESGEEHDILLYTGYEPDELDDDQRRAAAAADALVTGRYVASRPTDLVWRGSANQVMHLQTDLGRLRYAPHVDSRPENPALQLKVDAGVLWLVGVPRRGTLARLDRMLRLRGLDTRRASWRPAGDRFPRPSPEQRGEA
jgi:anaerobic ribonucleoside-triphosphate reductase activating protein